MSVAGQGPARRCAPVGAGPKSRGAKFATSPDPRDTSRKRRGAQRFFIRPTVGPRNSLRAITTICLSRINHLRI
jgi:hypothetical protein